MKIKIKDFVFSVRILLMKYEFLKLTPVKFDLIYGSALLIGSPLLITGEEIARHPLLIGIFGILVYVLEAWAFYYKITGIRIRALQASAKDWIDDGKLPRLPGLIIFGRGLRALIRASIFVISLNALNDYFGWWDAVEQSKSQFAFVLTFAAEGILWNMVLLRNSSDKPEAREKEIEEEERWRYRHREFFEDRFQLWKEIIADYVLLILAIMFTQSYWKYIMGFYEQRAEKALEENLTPGNVLAPVFITATLTAIIIMVPARLPSWVQDAWMAQDKKRRFRMRWSLWFALISVILPMVYHIISLYSKR